MAHKTKVHAEEGKQYLIITREFGLPVELLFKAHTDAEIYEQWMSHDYGKVRVTEYECRTRGGWRFETADAQGNVVFAANGVFHEVVPDKKITRTFAMENTFSDVQLEFLDFEELTADTSKLTMQIVYRSVSLRDDMLKVPFAQGLSMAHDRLENVLSKLKRQL